MIDFSPRASHLMHTLCQKEARSSGAKYLQPEHILLAILKKKDGLGYVLLERLGIDFEILSNTLEQEIDFKIDTKEASENLPRIVQLGQRTEMVIQLATTEAVMLENKYVGTEHIVLACIEENNSQAAKLCVTAGISVEKARALCLTIQKEFTSSYIAKRAEELANGALKDIFESHSPTLASSDRNFNPFDNLFLEDENPLQNEQRQKGEKRSFLSEYSRDITRLCRENKAEPVVGREKEIQRLIQILSRRTKNNPVLVGEPGIGKTAIAEGLAQKIAKGEVPAGLVKKRILSLDLSAMVAGTKYRGDFEERMKRMMKEIQEDKNIILFIDELHTLIGAGGPEGQMDASNMIKPALSRGEIQIIGATTTREYTRYIEKDSALARRFQKIDVEEPNDEDSIKILEGIKSQYEEFHGVIYSEGVIPTIVKLSRRYIPERFLPDKAIDILDEAGAHKKIQEENKPQELLELEEQINALIEEKKLLVKRQDFERAAYIRDRVSELKNKREVFSNYWKEHGHSKNQCVTPDDIAYIVSEMTGIPVDQMSSSETERLVNMEKEMHKMVIGQDDAVHVISGAIRRSRAGISSPKHPIGSFIFLGPTGVGKTQLAKALAKFMFGSEEHLIRIDMSDFMEKHNASRLVGAPPGYIGYEDGGVLTEQVRRHPYSVILLDEIEKAHPDIFNLLLQILEEGELSDNLGHTINFRNTVIIMTSNAGARQISAEGRLGFSTTTDGILPYAEIKASATSELKKMLSPELINRIDDTVVFNALSKKEVSQILDIQLAELTERLSEKGLEISLKKSARKHLVEHGFDANMGARPMRRLIQKEIEDPLSLEILNQKNKGLKHIVVDTSKGNLRVHFEKDRTTIKISTVSDISGTTSEDEKIHATTIKDVSHE